MTKGLSETLFAFFGLIGLIYGQVFKPCPCKRPLSYTTTPITLTRSLLNFVEKRGEWQTEVHSQSSDPAKLTMRVKGIMRYAAILDPVYLRMQIF